MNKVIFQLCVVTVLWGFSSLGFAAGVNPISVTYSNGNTNFAPNTSGSANYVVAVSAGVPSGALPLSLVSANATAGLVAAQVTSGSVPSGCGSASLCGSSFFLSAGQSCCLALTLTCAQTGHYSLQPTVSTTPAAYSAQAPSAQVVTVPSLSTSTVVSSSLNPSVSDSAVTFTANVSASAAVPSGGTVSFAVNGHVIVGCSAQALTAGVATCTTSSLTTATDSITATYSGGSGFLSSTTLIPLTQYVIDSTLSPLVAPSAPLNVIATPSNGQATISWTPPSNTGGAAITGYTVTYGLTSSGSYTTLGCSTGGVTSCVVAGLSNVSSYTFVVTATNNVPYTGTKGYSSSVTPSATLAATPANLALAVNGNARNITFANTSNSTLNISTVTAANLPKNTTFTNVSCSGSISASGFCTVTVMPGDTVSSNSSSQACSDKTGSTTVPGTITLATNGGSVVANVYVLDYGCTYQGGYLFSIDDATSTSTSSMGGKVMEPSYEQAPMTGTGWGGYISSTVGFASLWGIADQSTPASAKPSASGSPAATLASGQTNCDGANDGSCNTANIVIDYSGSNPNDSLAPTPGVPYPENVLSTTYSAAAVCKQSSENSYYDWYLPAICEMAPNGFTFVCDAASLDGNNMQNALSPYYLGMEGVFWSSTEQTSPQANPDSDNLYAWRENFTSRGYSGSAVHKYLTGPGIVCARLLTL